MYNLTEAWAVMHGNLPERGWDGKIYCTRTDSAMTLRTNVTQGFMAAYTFTIVTEGWLTTDFNGREITIHPNDLYIYSPGESVSVKQISDDYQGICLLADEQVALEIPTTHHLIHNAYSPIAHLSQPVLTLPDHTAQRLVQRMLEIISYIHSSHIYRDDVLKMLFAIFLLDVEDAQAQSVARPLNSKRAEELFLGFTQLLPHHFAEHHDIAFYADQLCISPVYLSRIVRQVSGRTVVDYINRMLATEAAFLLHTTSLTVSQISDRLHFADTPSFSKFFLRMKGMSPKDYRNTSR